LNPLLGTLQVLEDSDGRAASTDGTRWFLQIRSDHQEDMWGVASKKPSSRYYGFGNWSPKEGLRRVPLNPLLDAKRMLASADRLIAVLQDNCPSLPFPPRDSIELWLLDRNTRMPLALVASVPPGTDLDRVPAPDWTASAPGAIPADDGAPNTMNSARLHALETLIRSVRGPAQWFDRTDIKDARGLSVGRLTEFEHDRLPANAFPPLTIRETWDNPEDQALIDDYLDWLAPRLLTLHDLPDPTRRRLENAAMRQALVVDELWPLYPKIIEQQRLDTARVEARIRLAGSHPG
jgi:hypothetical protein